MPRSSCPERRSKWRPSQKTSLYRSLRPCRNLRRPLRPPRRRPLSPRSRRPRHRRAHLRLRTRRVGSPANRARTSPPHRRQRPPLPRAPRQVPLRVGALERTCRLSWLRSRRQAHQSRRPRSLVPRQARSDLRRGADRVLYLPGTCTVPRLQGTDRIEGRHVGRRAP